MDHSPIITWLNINTNNSTIESLANNSLTRLPKQFVWENDSTQKYKDCLRSPVPQTLIREYINDGTQIHDVNASLEKVEDILITTAKQCLKIKISKKHNRIKSSSNKKRFDRECRFKRNELRKLSNQKHRDPLNPILREEYHAVLTQYKTLLNSKKNEYYNAKILELEDSAQHTDTTKILEMS